MSKSKIEWTDRTWNPVTGCTKVSPGCANCYAERMAKRLRGRCDYPQDDPFQVIFHPYRLDEPFRWRKPSKVFVCSMGDLFHEHVNNQCIYDIMEIVSALPQHKFIILTKRPDRALEFFTLTSDQFHNLPNVWLGVSAENQQTADERIPILLQMPAAVRFVSCEPLLGIMDIKKYFKKSFDYDDSFINWVIAGGESGPGARPMHPDWSRSLRDQCQAAGVPFFFKQWGEWKPYSTNPITEPIPLSAMIKQKMIYRDNEFWSVPGKMDVEKAFKDFVSFKVGKKAAGRLLDGREWNEMPEVTKI